MRGDTGQLRADAAQQGVFLRNATGLVREISPLGAIAVGSFALSIGVALAFTITSTPTLYPGSNMIITLLITIIPAVLIAYLYGTLGTAMPRSGGEYVWMSRLISPGLGFTIYWGFFITQMVFIAVNLAIAFNWFGNGALFLLGKSLNNQGLINAGASLSKPVNTFIAATILNVVILGFMLLPTRTQMRVIIWVFLLAMVGIVVLAFRLLLESDFQGHLAANYGAGTFDNVISAAQKAGGETTWRWAPSIVAVAYVAQFIPMTYVVMYAGEIKNARRNVKTATYIATALFVVTLTVMSALLYKAVGYRFMSATAFLQISDPKHYPFDFPFSVNYAVLLVSKNSALITIIGVSFFIWAALTSVTILFSITRVVFAYSWDRVFPDQLAKVNSRTATPVNSAVAVAVIAEGLLYLVLYTSAFANLLFAAIAYWVLWAGVGLAAVILPYRRKELWESSVASNRKLFGVPMVSIVGGAVVLLAALSMPFLFVNGAGVINGAVAWVLVVFYVGGPVLFFVARYIRRRQGIDMDLAYREIPAE